MGNPQTEKTYLQIIELQKKLSKTTNCHDAYAIEETLNSLVEKLAKGETSTNKQIRNMKRDRWRKEYQRRITDGELIALNDNHISQKGEVMLFEIQRRLTPQNFDLIVRKASGYSYNELSKPSNASSPDALKKRVSRIRQQLIPLIA